jgi:5-methylcytosine-specific restriction endonuclease McrA
MDKITPVAKSCKDCGSVFPNTQEFFPKRSCQKSLLSRCYECDRAKQRKWVSENRDRARGYYKKYRSNNADKIKEFAKNYFANNEEKERARWERYRSANRDKVRNATKRSYQKHQEKRLIQAQDYRQREAKKIRKYSKDYIKNHPLWHKQYCAKKRAKKYKVFIDPSTNYAAIYKRDRGICHCCGKKVARKELVFDHVLPLSCGGSHSPENIKVACYVCNRNRKDGRPNRKAVLPAL